MVANGKPVVLAEATRRPDDMTLTMWLETVAQVIAAILGRQTDQPTGKPDVTSNVECATRGTITDDASR